MLKVSILVAIDVSSRLALIAFATVALRGVLDGATFEATVTGALTAAVILWPIGFGLGDLGRRLVDDLVQKDVEPVVAQFREVILLSHTDAQAS